MTEDTAATDADGFTLVQRKRRVKPSSGSCTNTLKDFPDITVTENGDNDPTPTRGPAVPDYPDKIDIEGDDLYVDAVESLPPVQAAEDPNLANALENPLLLDILDNELQIDDQVEENGDQGTDGGQHNTPPANGADLLNDDQLPVVLLPP
ncbi:hypothetical protein HPB47_003340 [Ixodes persulcatus]|uniref:Uncharacterized protein n=1 Tax=Ixodes persulcatus TaxID=34615 RepID=A0AC60PJV1_IXOPE|nr:hypothetical protein HPB47_003340 [Ixodes persulcatus]